MVSTKADSYEDDLDREDRAEELAKQDAIK